MATKPPPSAYSRSGFQRLGTPGGGDATVDIPLQRVDSNIGRPSYANTMENNSTTFLTEKQGLVQSSLPKQRPISELHRGHRHKGRRSYDGEEDSITKMGFVYNKIMNFSVITRYLLYIIPIGVLIAIPIIIGATVKDTAEVGDVRMVWFFVWLECCWSGLWISKIVAHYLPTIFQALCGVVSPGTRKYSLLLAKLEIPLSLTGWALVSLATFMPIMTRNPDARAKNLGAETWMTYVQQALGAALVSTLVLLAERVFVQALTLNYHQRQFAAKIKENKHNVWLIGLLFDASRAMFPSFCPEFAEEDAVINDTIIASLPKSRRSGNRSGHGRSGSSTPMRMLQNAGRFGDKVASVFGHMAQDVTGKKNLDPESAHAIVLKALEKTRSSEALARRIWMSFVVEGQESLYAEDIIDAMGPERQSESEECFSVLDRDSNGDVTLDEMIMTVTEYGRDRHAIHNSMHDVDQAINVLDNMLCAVVLIAAVFIFIAFLNHSFVTTLATAGTALLSLSFVFSVTCQEILGSCIFLFVKHPYDIGDRVDMTSGTDQFLVEHISLLFTVFKRITTGKTVQIPNIVLNTLWIENVSRSKAMKEQLSIFVAFDTSFEDVQLLKNEMIKFVRDKDNYRDFQPDLDVEILGLGSMDKLELRIELLHKSNWANETLRAARRSKFLCALVLALRKVPIYGPGGGDPAIGEPGNPSYSVTVTNSEAKELRDVAAKDKEKARMVPSKKVDTADSDLLGPESELRAFTQLNERSPAIDGARDYGTARGNETMNTDRPGYQASDLEEVRGIMRSETTKGKRKPSTTIAPSDAPQLDTQVPDVGPSSENPLQPPYITGLDTFGPYGNSVAHNNGNTTQQSTAAEEANEDSKMGQAPPYPPASYSAYPSSTTTRTTNYPPRAPTAATQQWRRL